MVVIKGVDDILFMTILQRNVGYYMLAACDYYSVAFQKEGHDCLCRCRCGVSMQGAPWAPLL